MLMKRLVLYQLLLALCFVSLSHAAQDYCMHLTKFCDTLTLAQSGDLAYGGWDLDCAGNWWGASILGNVTLPPRELATRPVDVDGDLSYYTFQFSLLPDKLFTLWGTDGFGPLGLFIQQMNQPYTITKGACTRADIDTSKPRLMSSVRQLKTPIRPQQPLGCMHFTNFCDTIVLTGATDGSKLLAYGNWDFQCTGDWTDANIIGYVKAGHELATRPGIQYRYISPYSTEFSFKSGQVFDLYATAGVDQGVFKARSDQPYNVTDGACAPGDVDSSKPSLLGSR